MSSSISSSEPVRSPWGGFALTLVGVAVALLVAILAFAYAVDPYDTGRSSLFEKVGVRPQGPRTAAASRGRDEAYNAAIFGNSHIQLLSPERLKQSTGLDFVQLSVPASGPKEQLVLIDWFLRHRDKAPEAIVISADEEWCTLDPTMANKKPFPFWLFSANPLDYARNLLRYDILEEVPRRLGYVFGDEERARPDGYWNYEPEYRNLGYATDPTLRQRLEKRPESDSQVLDQDPMAGQRHFPAADSLKALAGSLPARTRLVVVFPPNYKNYLTLPRTARGYQDQACKAALRSALGDRPRTALIDWRVDRPENRDPDLYFDLTHYRLPIAHLVEADIAGALKQMP
ncbi:hypothetical protein [Microvirga pudoricolor]|uniref:hypothetical protein n=1 Tax=Microvirga pudoricolor TaxID=2778729 RepID=UPI0019516105|nr:hypothetical protein [Microvirga pudoricolor]MBM6594622.1 hypothetical protein [Microvirga pudoricolor]